MNVTEAIMNKAIDKKFALLDEVASIDDKLKLLKKMPEKDVCPQGANLTVCPGNPCGVQLQTDPKNCGACGKACPTGAICKSGKCACADTGTPVTTSTPATW